MERRKFLKTSLISGIGISVIPVTCLGISASVSSISMTNVFTKGHVRHGLLNPNFGEFYEFSSWFKNFKKDIFHKNGYKASKEDLLHLSFELNDNRLSIHKLDESLLIVTNHRSERVDLSEHQEVTLFESNCYDCKIYNIDSTLSLNKSKDQYFLPMDNSIIVEGAIINENTVVNVREDAPMNFIKIKCVEESATVLKITKK